jgi:hypothetical protein
MRSEQLQELRLRSKLGSFGQNLGPCSRCVLISCRIGRPKNVETLLAKPPFWATLQSGGNAPKIPRFSKDNVCRSCHGFRQIVRDIKKVARQLTREG